MLIGNATEAYERQPSGSPATEPITFSITTGDASNCYGAFYYAIRIKEGTNYGYTVYHEDTQEDTWTDVLCTDLSWTGTGNCETDFTVDAVDLACNQEGTGEATWSDTLDGTDWTWAIEAAAPTGTTTTTTDITDTELGAFAIIVFLIAAFTGYILIR